MEKPDLSRIPLGPGVYLFKNEQDRILYVGKAKSLRRRLASYFRAEGQIPQKTRAMLQRAVTLDTISTDTDNEAFLLEAGLIKKHRPRYNILLRDDKDYVLFRLRLDSPYPRLEILRKGKSGKGKSGKEGRKVRHFGPFVSGLAAKSTWKYIHKAFPLRRCSDRSFKNRSRPCLYYHMGQCPAPCVLEVPQAEYAAMLDKVILLLEGKSTELLRALAAEMRAASEALDFERAAALRDQIRAVEHTVEKQSVVLPQERDLDAVGLMENERGLGLGLLMVRGGALLGSRNYFWPGLGMDEADEALSSFLVQYYAEAEGIPPLIVLPWLPGGGAKADPEPDKSPDEAVDKAALEALFASIRGGPARLALPRGQAEGELVSLASANARDAARQRREDRLPELLARAFMRDDPITRLEAVDVSHTSGRATRAGLVVFEDGRPLKSDWRSYSFEDGGGDDYGVLAAWAARRAAAGPPWPDLMLIDGGKGQLAVVDKVFGDLGLRGAFALAAIAKARDEDGHSDRRAGNVSDRIFVPGRSNPLNLKPGSPELLFLQHARNHAHDFVIGRHRQARGQLALQGELNRIPGFGPAFTRRLWEKFDSLEAMALASDEALRAVEGMGPARIKTLREHLARVVDKKL